MGEHHMQILVFNLFDGEEAMPIVPVLLPVVALSVV